MFKLALNAVLSGYANEQWLTRDNIYMPESGCNNRNGHVSPRYDVITVGNNSSLSLVSNLLVMKNTNIVYDLRFR